MTQKKRTKNNISYEDPFCFFFVVVFFVAAPALCRTNDEDVESMVVPAMRDALRDEFNLQPGRSSKEELQQRLRDAIAARGAPVAEEFVVPPEMVCPTVDDHVWPVEDTPRIYDVEDYAGWTSSSRANGHVDERRPHPPPSVLIWSVIAMIVV